MHRLNPNRLWRSLSLLCCAVLLCAPSVANAAPSGQPTTATLTIINQSEQTVCTVLIAATTATEWGADRLGDEPIKPGATYSFTLALDNYDVALVDCDNHVLLNRRGLAVVTDAELSLTQSDVQHIECDIDNEQGLQAYRRGHYAEALAGLQAASACYHKIGDRGSEGTTLSNIGVVYADQGRNTEALAQYAAALTIRREVGDRAGEGITLLNIGVVYYDQRRYAEALAHYAAALAIMREVGDRTTEGTILDNIGVVYANQGRNAEALAAYEAALAVVREVGDRTTEGTTRNNIGIVYADQGRYAEALAAYEAALTIRREVGDRTAEGQTLTGIGAVYAAQGRNAEALAQYAAALTIVREVGDRATEGATLGSIGVVYANQGRNAEALAQYEAALAIVREVGNRATEGQILNNIGRVYDAQGLYGKALAAYEAALVIRREVGDRAGEGTTLKNIGGLYRTQGRYAEALAQFEVALAIARAVGNRRGEGQTLDNIAVVYDAQGRYAEALPQYEVALAIAREMGNRADEAITLNNVGRAYQDQRRYGEALAAYEAALAITREVDDRASEGITHNGIGFVYSAQRRYTEALAQFEAALAITREVGDRAGEGASLNNIGSVYFVQRRYTEALAAYAAALAILREVGDRAAEGQTLANIGVIYAAQEQYTKALSSYQQAMIVFDDLRATAGSESARAAFIAQHTDVYDQAIGIYLRQKQGPDAFLTSERGRARSFLDSLATGQVELFDNAAANLLARENEAYTVRQSAQDALAQAKALNPPNPQLVADLEQQLATAETAHAQALSAIQSRSNRLADLVPGRNNNVLSLLNVQQQLDDQTTLVSYWVLSDTTWAFVVTADQFTVIELPDAQSEALRTTLQNLYAWSNRENPRPRALRNLYSWLIAPLAERIHTPHVAIVPHQSLHYVPFAALTDGETYFGEQHTLSILPSASALPFLAQNAQRAQANHSNKALVFGNPTTDDPTLPPLAYAVSEAGAIADLLHTSVYTASAASEAYLRANVADTSIVHLAAHGGYNAVNPLYSLIALAPGVGDDGRLETHEIFGLPLQGNDLVVLSACQTNVGDLSRGDEVVGLTRAFFFAGSPTVISSLWSVDDAATETLMVSFYTHWLHEGLSKAEALQAAQADVRTNPRWASPFYWAGFVLNGHPGIQQ